MKYLLFIVLIAAVLVTAGCTGGKQASAATPAPNPVHTPAQSPATPAPETVSVKATVPSATILTISPAITTDQSDSKTYADKEFNFSIRIPKCWTASGEYITSVGQVKKYKVVFDDPTFTSMQYVTITPDSAGLPLDEWAGVFLTQQKSDPTVSVVSQSPFEIDGTPAKKIILTTGSGEDAIESTIILVVKGNNAYFMEFASRTSDYPRYSQDADRMISTFRFT